MAKPQTQFGIKRKFLRGVDAADFLQDFHEN